MIVKIPNPVLNTAAKTVAKIDKKILGVVNQMVQTLIATNNPKGVGLAAPQIGIGLKIFITRPATNSPVEVFLNPEIIKYSKVLSEIKRLKKDPQNKAHDKKLEGCLSIPNVWGYLKRSQSVLLRYMDIEGKISEKEFDGFMATIIQHETDHLNGILFTQRVLEQNQKLYRIEKNNEGNEKLVEIEIK